MRVSTCAATRALPLQVTRTPGYFGPAWPGLSVGTPCSLTKVDDSLIKGSLSKRRQTGFVRAALKANLTAFVSEHNANLALGQKMEMESDWTVSRGADFAIDL